MSEQRVIFVCGERRERRGKKKEKGVKKRVEERYTG